jgi:predicted RecA/RadA family phage recombinase
MATNEIYRDADHLALPVPTGTKANDPVLIGGLKGVAETDRDDQGEATVWLKGGHKFTVDGAVTAKGQPVYFQGDGTTRSATLSTTATGNTLFGHALETKSAAAAAITVRIARA